MEFPAFPKIPRLNRDCVITEKIDGTNGQVNIVPKNTYITGLFDEECRIEVNDYWIFAGSRSRWVSFKEDNHGFYKWVAEHKDELVTQLGEGQHFGEWWGAGINKRYPGAPKTFSLFNTLRWTMPKLQKQLTICDVVPVLYEGQFNTSLCNEYVQIQREQGSLVWPGAKAEGIVVFHKAAGSLFKVTCEKDESPKGTSHEPDALSHP